jgi:tRNA nucleotidyltransferase (CCA-adding enzyme)
MTNLRHALQSAVVALKPSPQEEKELNALTSSLLSKTRDAAKRYSQVHDVILGGSFAKGTWLPKDVDIDIFVRISADADEKDFERIGLEIGARATEGYPRGKKFAQHPYTEALVDGVKVNIVPCYFVEPMQWKSAADRSPFHVMLVERLPESQKQQVRMLKRFMKTVGVYGAEIESQGFSGYAAEVLVIQYNDFEGVLRYFADFKPASEETYFHLVDPIDSERDLARAISREKVARMVLASRSFLRKPASAYFSKIRAKRRPSVEPLLVGLVFSHAVLSEDTLWGELKKTLRHVEVRLESRGFRVARSIAVSNGKESSAFLFLPELDTLPDLELRMGPPVEKKAETKEFLSRNAHRAKLIWVGEDTRVRLFQTRDRKRLVELLSDTVRDVKDIGASKEMAAGILASGMIVSGSRLSKVVSSKAWLKKGLEEIAGDTIGTSVA